MPPAKAAETQSRKPHKYRQNIKNRYIMAEKKKVVVAFSGGLDTSYTVMKLSHDMGYEVYAACANTGVFSDEQLNTN